MNEVITLGLVNFFTYLFMGLMAATIMRGSVIITLHRLNKLHYLFGIILGGVIFVTYMVTNHFLFVYILFAYLIIFFRRIPLVTLFITLPYIMQENRLLAVAFVAFVIFSYGIKQLTIQPQKKLLLTFIGAFYAFVVELYLSNGDWQNNLILISCFFCLCILFICIYQWVRDYNQLFTTLYRDAFFDSLTQLPNRHYFHQHFKNLKTKDSMAMIDIDFFRNYENLYGYTITNQIVKTIGQLLLEQFAGIGLAFRYNNDRFYLLFDSDNSHHCINELRHFKANVEDRTFTIEGNPIQITLSIGIKMNREEMEVKQLAQLCHEALVRSKITGRNKITIL